MSKEYLEALEIVDNILDNFGGEKVQIETMTLCKCNILTIKQALQRIKAIDNSKPSEALECLKSIKLGIRSGIFYSLNDRESFINNKDFDAIKQELIKSQEQEKENAEYKRVLKILFGKNVNIFQLRLCKTLDEYNARPKEERLTQEEFNLLKRYADGK